MSELFDSRHARLEVVQTKPESTALPFAVQLELKSRRETYVAFSCLTREEALAAARRATPALWSLDPEVFHRVRVGPDATELPCELFFALVGEPVPYTSIPLH